MTIIRIVLEEPVFESLASLRFLRGALANTGLYS